MDPFISSARHPGVPFVPFRTRSLAFSSCALVLSVFVSPVSAEPSVDIVSALQNVATRHYPEACQQFYRSASADGFADRFTPASRQRFDAFMSGGSLDGVLHLADSAAAKGRHVASCVEYAIAWVGGVRHGKASRRLISAAHRGLVREALEADQAAVDAVANSDGPGSAFTTIAAAPQPKRVDNPDGGTPSMAATCLRLARRFSATKSFAEASADELRQTAAGKIAPAWIAEAQAADNAGSTAVACVGYLRGAAAYRADGNAVMANIWGIDGVGRSSKVADSQPEPQGKSAAPRPSMANSAPIGRYGCSSFQSTYMTLSSMPEMKITSATRYAALGSSGTFTAETVQRPDPSIDALLRFRTGPLAGKYADAVRQDRGTRALVFPKGELDISSTVCALQAK